MHHKNWNDQTDQEEVISRYRHPNFKWVKINHVRLILEHIFPDVDLPTVITFPITVHIHR